MYCAPPYQVFVSVMYAIGEVPVFVRMAVDPIPENSHAWLGQLSGDCVFPPRLNTNEARAPESMGLVYASRANGPESERPHR